VITSACSWTGNMASYSKRPNWLWNGDVPNILIKKNMI
jgi:hypothetical protein